MTVRHRASKRGPQRGKIKFVFVDFELYKFQPQRAPYKLDLDEFFRKIEIYLII